MAERLNISWFDVSKKFSDYIQSEEYNGKFKSIYLNFCAESKNELFDSPQEATDFYSKKDPKREAISSTVSDSRLSAATHFSKLKRLSLKQFLSIFTISR